MGSSRRSHSRPTSRGLSMARCDGKGDRMCREALLPCPPHAYIIYDISHLQPREGTGSVFTSAPSPPLFHPSITSPANFARSFLPSSTDVVVPPHSLPAALSTGSGVTSAPSPGRPWRCCTARGSSSGSSRTWTCPGGRGPPGWRVGTGNGNGPRGISSTRALNKAPLLLAACFSLSGHAAVFPCRYEDTAYGKKALAEAAMAKK